MSSFKHLLEHAIDIQASDLIRVIIALLTSSRRKYSLITGSYTSLISKWVDYIRRWETTIRRDMSLNWLCLVSPLWLGWKFDYTFTYILIGKTLEVNTQARSQGKYSMESALMIRVHAGLQAIKEDPRARIH